MSKDYPNTVAGAANNVLGADANLGKAAAHSVGTVISNSPGVRLGRSAGNVAKKNLKKVTNPKADKAKATQLEHAGKQEMSHAHFLVDKLGSSKMPSSKKAKLNAKVNKQIQHGHELLHRAQMMKSREESAKRVNTVGKAGKNIGHSIKYNIEHPLSAMRHNFKSQGKGIAAVGAMAAHPIRTNAKVGHAELNAADKSISRPLDQFSKNVAHADKVSSFSRSGKKHGLSGAAATMFGDDLSHHRIHDHKEKSHSKSKGKSRMKAPNSNINNSYYKQADQNRQNAISPQAQKQNTGPNV